MRKVKQMSFQDEKPTHPDVPSVLPPSVEEPAQAATDPTIDIASYRLAASMLLTYAVDGAGVGSRSVNDVVYRTIVEGRVAPKYSSCGDLAHWLLFRLGVRAPWINRSEFRAPGGPGWRVERNLNLLTPEPVGTCSVGVKPSQLEAVPDVQPGDILLISNVYGGHAMCVSGRDGVTITTAEYGQPGGAKKAHPLRIISGHLFVGANQVTSWLSLPAVLALPGCVPPDLRALTTAERETLGKGLPGFSAA